jgi:hypothetical protein
MQGVRSCEQKAIRIPNFRAMESQASSSNPLEKNAAAHRPTTRILLPGIESLVKSVESSCPPLSSSSSSSIRAKKTSCVAVPSLLRNSSGPRSALVLPLLPASGPGAFASVPQQPHQQQTFEHPEQCMLCGGTMTSSRDRKYKNLQSLAQRIEESCIPTPFVYRQIVNAARNERADETARGTAMSPCCIACFNWIKRLADPADPSVATFERKIIPLDNLIMFLNNPGGNCISSKVDIPVPDCRSVFRLMCHLSSETVVRPPSTATARTSGMPVPCEYRLKNPYLMFFSPITERIVECFGTFYGSSEPVFVGQLNAQTAVAQQPGRRAIKREGGENKQAAKPLEGARTHDEKREEQRGKEDEEEEEEQEEETEVNTEEAMYRIVYWWWESTGMPVVMPHKQCAQYVRKALRADSIRKLPDTLLSPSDSPSASACHPHVPPVHPA